MAAEERRLAACLRGLGCPAYLEPTQERLTASAYRRTLILWLFALYKHPAARQSGGDQWVRDEPTDEELIRWLQLVLGAENDAQAASHLLEQGNWSEVVMEQLCLVVETVRGRVAVTEQGESAIVQDASDFLADIAANQQSVFDTRCELFPMSIQMMAKELRHGSSSTAMAKLLGDDIVSLRQQRDVLDQRIQSVRERLEDLGNEPIEHSNKDSKSLSKELAKYLTECVDLIKRATMMFKEDLEPWIHPPKPQLIGVGQAASDAYAHLESVLAFLENTQSFTDLGRDQRQMQATLDVAKDCQRLVDRIAPGLRDQLQTLEDAVSTF